MVDYPIGDLVAERVRAMGVDAVLQALRARRRPRAEHRDRLQRPRPRRPRPGRVLQPQQRGRGAAEARRLRLGRDLRRRRPLVPQRRHLRGAVGDDRRADHRGDAGREGARGGRVLRSELPREAVERRGRRTRARARQSSAGSSSTWTCSSATKRTCRRAWASQGPEVAATSKLDPDGVLRDDRRGRREVPADQGRRHDAARRALHQPPHAGAPSRGSTGQRISRRRATSTSTTASAAATGSPPGLFYGLLTGESPSESVRLGWAHGALVTTFPGDTTMATSIR